GVARWVAERPVTGRAWRPARVRRGTGRASGSAEVRWQARPTQRACGRPEVRAPACRTPGHRTPGLRTPGAQEATALRAGEEQRAGLGQEPMGPGSNRHATT